MGPARHHSVARMRVMYEPSLTVDGMTCALWVERAPQLVHEGLPLGNVGEGGVVIGVGAGDAGGCE
jgi:hypothetical protein